MRASLRHSPRQTLDPTDTRHTSSHPVAAVIHLRQIHRVKRPSVAPLFAVVSAVVSACGGSQARETATFVYQDTYCGLAVDGSTCTDVGDGRAYSVCSSDGDCSPTEPFCRTLGLFHGGDFNCNASVTICRSVDHDDCAR